MSSLSCQVTLSSGSYCPFMSLGWQIHTLLGAQDLGGDLGSSLASNSRVHLKVKLGSRHSSLLLSDLQALLLPHAQGGLFLSWGKSLVDAYKPSTPAHTCRQTYL